MTVQHLAVGATALFSGSCDVSMVSRADCLSAKFVKCGARKKKQGWLFVSRSCFSGHK